MDIVYEPTRMHTSLCSILVDDDFFDCKWSPSSPRRRCDRHGSFSMDCGMGPNRGLRASAMSSNGSSSMARSREELFFYCTEELGSESSAGVGHAFTFTTAAAPALPPVGKRIEEAANPSVGRNSLPDCSSAEVHDLRHYHQQCPPSEAARTFPPPLSSLLCDRPLLRSFKSDGRFVLKKVDNASRSLFRSTRKDGRLRLDLLKCPSRGIDNSLFPANPPLSVPSLNVGKPPLLAPSYLIYPSLNSSPLSHKSPLTLCPQALALLMHSKSTCSPLVEEPKAPPSPSSSFASSHQIANCATNVKTTPSTLMAGMPHVFALLNLFPVGLGLIIFEFGQSKFGNFLALHGIYIMKSLGFHSTRDFLSSAEPFSANLCGNGGTNMSTHTLPPNDRGSFQHHMVSKKWWYGWF